jgi:hypothetical protein
MHVNRLLGFARWRAKQWAMSIGPLQVAFNYEPRDPEVIFVLGLAYLHDGQAEKAHRCLRYWARLHSEGAQRLAKELRAPRPPRVEVEAHEAYLVLRGDAVAERVQVLRGAVSLMRSAGVSRRSCRQLSQELDKLEESIRQLPELDQR